MSKVLKWQDAPEEMRQAHLLKVYSNGKGWTTEPPKEDGWYFFRAKDYLGHGPHTELSYVSVMNNVVSFSPLIDGYEWDHEYEVKDVTHWLGPLPVPDPPQG